MRVRAWDGSVAGPARAATTIVLRSRGALRCLAWHPDELGAARAYVAGDLDLETPEGLGAALRQQDMVDFGTAARRARRMSRRQKVRLLVDAARLGALGPPPQAPAEEARLAGTRHSRQRDAEAISHHYDLGNDFYRLLLGPSMVYSCGYWRRGPGPEYGVTDAQRDKMDLICGKLGLQRRQRLLDVGCGWGSLVLHAAAHYGARAVGVTLSPAQASFAADRVREAGLADRVEVRVQDYREVTDGPFDAIVSVGMAEHLGAANYPIYSARLFDLLQPGGRLLHHQITKARPPADPHGRQSFIDSYIFPDGELLPVGTVIGHLEDSGLEVRDVEGLREHYVLTLNAWSTNLEENWETACRLTSQARARAWRLYLAGSASAFASNSIGIHQVLAVAPMADGSSALPMRRPEWVPDLAARAAADRGYPRAVSADEDQGGQASITAG